MSELPAGWVQVELKDVVDRIVGGGTPSKSIPSYYQGEIPWMTVKDMNKSFLTDTVDHITDEAVKNSSTNIIPAGVPIIATRMSLGKIVRASFDSAINQDLKALFVSKEIDQYFFEYWYRSQADHIESLGTGTTVKGVRLEVINALQFPLAPLAEQVYIAQKLDQLLVQVDTLKARIDAILTLLKHFRQSVLAAAVSGQLTEEWRTKNPSYVSRTKNSCLQADNNNLTKDGPLPINWVLKSAEDICGFITKGTTPSKEKMVAGEGEVPYIKVYNLTFSGGLDFSVDPTFINYKTHSIDLKRSIVKPGDVLMNIVGPPLGKVSVVPDTYPEWNINQAIARFRAENGISSEYLALCLRSDTVLNRAVSLAKATAGQFNLTLKICRELPLPVPPEVEQTEIVRRVEQLFAFADQLEAKVTAAKNRIDHLTQSILAKAFRGELVPQDPNDEPASVLLERIKAQRAAAPKVKRGRKASV